MTAEKIDDNPLATPPWFWALNLKKYWVLALRLEIVVCVDVRLAEKAVGVE